ncbi:putative aminomethyltransferase, mitochondrial [Colletotrichum spaethianum]|uniref:Aminomethyltransferase, mitochondrial n=1 Tax=Colletotrichum spaethianum TaxID=700344 RepID=A0AA37PE82_9PEZI|nr:putative aminomethyltransferase, mitochondrial [Colletotrichum spaethianum]GKT50676.1 putative aminomethyltransferase, mitochondrial [Colletotrichum spaethianum]
MKFVSAVLFSAAAAVALGAPNHSIKGSQLQSNASGPGCGEDSNRLLQTAPTKYVSVNGTKMAYRRLGKRASAPPLLFITHFRGSMDVLDPELINAIAKNREVIIYDNTGVGHSEGTVPDSIEAMAQSTLNLLAEINVPKVDILGFSMGGMVAQYIGMEHHDMANKLIFAGIRPGYGPGVVQTPPDAASGPGGEPDRQPTEVYNLGIFFYPSETSRTAGDDWWHRIYERQIAGEERKDFLVGQGVAAQLTAITAFASDPQMYARLANITAPVLVTSGHDDLLMGTANSFVLQQNLPDARLHIYPDSAHGHLFQFPLAYARELELFLRE